MHVLRLPATRGAHLSWLTRMRSRGNADRWLRASGERGESHPAFAWRAAELTSPRERRVLARTLHGVVADVTAPRSTFTASPLNRRGLVPYAEEIEQLADCVGDLERPVTAAGIVFVRDLITDGGSPLYTGGCVTDLPRTLSFIRAALAREDSTPSCQPPSVEYRYPAIELTAGPDGSASGARDPHLAMTENVDG